MSKMTGSLLRRNRHLLGVVSAPSVLVSQAINPQRSQLQPSTKSLSQRYIADMGGEELEEQYSESIADTVPAKTADTPSPMSQPGEPQSSINVRQTPANADSADIEKTANSRPMSHTVPQQANEKGQNGVNTSFSVKGVESPQRRPSEDEQVAGGRRSADPPVKEPASAQAEEGPVVETVIKEPVSKPVTVANGQSDRPYIEQLKQIQALHEALYVEQGSRISRVEAELATTNAGLQKPAATAQQKPLLPNRNSESLASPKTARRLQTRVNIGAINVEVVEPAPGVTAAPAGVKRQTKLSSRKSYRGQSGVRKHFGFGQL